MMNRFFAGLLAAFMLLFVQAATAGDKGTADEAKALAAKATDLIRSAGPDAAFAKFMDPQGGFIDRDLYVFVCDMQGKVLAHGTNKNLVGKGTFTLKDADGKPFVEEMAKIAAGPGEGWVDYKWTNATTKKIEPKSTFVKRVGDMFVAVGIYK